MKDTEPVSLGQVVESYQEMTASFEDELRGRTEGEVDYANAILPGLRKGKSIKAALDEAGRQYPQEALQYDDDNLEAIHAHYDYLLKHEKIKNRIRQISN